MMDAYGQAFAVFESSENKKKKKKKRQSKKLNVPGTKRGKVLLATAQQSLALCLQVRV